MIRRSRLKVVSSAAPGRVAGALPAVGERHLAVLRAHRGPRHGQEVVPPACGASHVLLSGARRGRRRREHAELQVAAWDLPGAGPDHPLVRARRDRLLLRALLRRGR